MKYVLVYLLVLVIILAVFLIFNQVIRKKQDELGLQKSSKYIIKKYKLKDNKSNRNKLSVIMDVVDSFILSIPVFMIIEFDINYWLMVGISLVIYIVLMLIMYNLVGYILSKKGW